MPIDIIKLDRQFFESDSLINTRITDLIVEFAEKHKILIVSEGVENEEMLATVRKMGINLVQGFYFSKPLLVADLHNLSKTPPGKGTKHSFHPRNLKFIANLFFINS